MPAPASSIRAFVQWTDQTVYAGEDIQCKITFKNVAPAPGGPKAATSVPKANGFAPGGERQRKTLPLQSAPTTSRSTPVHPPRSPVPGPSHRQSLSLNGPFGGSRSFPSGGGGTASKGRAPAPGHKHRRSISIVSLGSDEGAQTQNMANAARRPLHAHGRSASLQVVPRRAPAMNGSAMPGHRAATQPSHQFHSSTPPTISEHPDFAFLPSASRRSSAALSTAPTARPTHGPRQASGSLSQTWQFPSASSQNLSPRASSTNLSGSRSGPPSKASDDGSSHPELLTPSAKLISGSSVNGGTPRSSGEFYSVSNNSTETLASDYVSQVSNRWLQRPVHARRASHLSSSTAPKPPESLMMGYAQIVGSFTLDGSLVNQAPFEEIKRRSVVGGQAGGGVVGVENKAESGLFGALGWSNIGESLGGLLGVGELSSIREMRGIASSKTIPLLSTPQSILFVDLQLGPGESKSYRYTFPLPRGLPPSHRGKAIKVSYNLVIGTQRPATATEPQQLRHVEVPFRVLAGVDEQGEILGHDLMSPHVLLTDRARTVSVDTSPPPERQARRSKRVHASQHDFKSYVTGLLRGASEDPDSTPLSPTERTLHPVASFNDDTRPRSAKEAIDLAILRSNARNNVDDLSTNRFEIARNGRRVAVLLLARPAYRLGETIMAILDFSGAAIPTYAVHASLETEEKVDAAIALRSGSSIARVTRKVHAHHSENTLYARRIVFTPTIPLSATPDFVTSGVALEWKLRVEFVTPRMRLSEPEQDVEGGDDNEEDEEGDEGAQDPLTTAASTPTTETTGAGMGSNPPSPLAPLLSYPTTAASNRPRTPKSKNRFRLSLPLPLTGRNVSPPLHSHPSHPPTSHLSPPSSKSTRALPSGTSPSIPASRKGSTATFNSTSRPTSSPNPPNALLEETSSDDRARIYVALQSLQVEESFDVGIRIRVFGSSSSGSAGGGVTDGGEKGGAGHTGEEDGGLAV
ncbi:MAG: hypothetical protein M1838_004183 [Thelocarpon superellum]|nr:MAG: hypothetical protein M1838_004183 [Thelocarpon superellum]